MAVSPSMERAAFIAQVIAELERPAALARSGCGNATSAVTALSNDMPDARSVAARDVDALTRALSLRLDEMAASPMSSDGAPYPAAEGGNLELRITRALVEGVLVCLSSREHDGVAPPAGAGGLAAPSAAEAAVVGLACVLFVKAPAVLLRLPPAVAVGVLEDDADVHAAVGDLLEHMPHGAVVAALNAEALLHACDVLHALLCASATSPVPLLLGAGGDCVARLAGRWTQPLFLVRDRLLSLSGTDSEEYAVLLSHMLAAAEASEAAARLVWHALAAQMAAAPGGANSFDERETTSRTVSQTRELWGIVNRLVPSFFGCLHGAREDASGASFRDVVSVCALLRFVVSAPSISSPALADAVTSIVSSGVGQAVCELACALDAAEGVRGADATARTLSGCLLFMAIRFPECILPTVSSCEALLLRVRNGDGRLGAISFIAWPLLLSVPERAPTPLRSYTRPLVPVAEAMSEAQTALFECALTRAGQVCVGASQSLQGADAVVRTAAVSSEAAAALARAVALCAEAVEVAEFIGSAARHFGGLQRLQRFGDFRALFSDLASGLTAASGALAEATRGAEGDEVDDVAANGPAAMRERAAASAMYLRHLASRLPVAVRGLHKAEGAGKLD